MRRQYSTRRGFTLIDVLGAIVIVGTAVAAVMNWMTAGSVANARTGKTAVAIVLANSVHDYALTLNPCLPPTTMPTTDPLYAGYLVSLNGRNFAHPITASGNAATNLSGAAMNGLADWTLNTSVTSVHSSDLLAPPLTTGILTTDIRHLTVRVNYKRQFIYAADWLIAPAFPLPPN